jgi:ABC-2 type transport system permease protein
MIRRKDFIVSVLLTPIIAVGLGLIMAWVRDRQEKEQHRIAVVREAGPAGVAAPDSLPALAGIVWVEPSGADATPRALKSAIASRKVEGAVIIPRDYAEGGKVKVLVRRESPGWKKKIESGLHERARLARAAARGLGPDGLKWLDAPVALEEELAVPASRTTRGDRVAALLSMLLVIMTIFISGSYMNIGITGEKQARMTEVIVSAIRPQSWIDGKIVAYTLVGLLQVLLWSLTGLVIGLFFAHALPPRMNPGIVTVFLLFAVLGLVFYNSLYAVIAATIKDLQSTQKFQAYLFFLPMIPLFFVEAAVDTPDATWLAVISILPPFAPILMPMRVAVSGAAPWEMVVALVGLVIAAHYMRLAAGHAFRIGMLMYGKELTLPELVRWAKAEG